MAYFVAHFFFIFKFLPKLGYSAFHILKTTCRKSLEKTLLRRLNISNFMRNITYYSELNAHCKLLNSKQWSVHIQDCGSPQRTEKNILLALMGRVILRS